MGLLLAPLFYFTSESCRICCSHIYMYEEVDMHGTGCGLQQTWKWATHSPSRKHDRLLHVMVTDSFQLFFRIWLSFEQGTCFYRVAPSRWLNKLVVWGPSHFLPKLHFPSGKSLSDRQTFGRIALWSDNSFHSIPPPLFFHKFCFYINFFYSLLHVSVCFPENSTNKKGGQWTLFCFLPPGLSTH